LDKADDAGVVIRDVVEEVINEERGRDDRRRKERTKSKL
jgi:hypothetical protein